MSNSDDLIIVTVMNDGVGFGDQETAAATVAFGRYRLLGLLGRGGMGEVYRAYDTQTDRMVALKLLKPGLADDPEFNLRFRQEARAAATLNEPHVVPIHDFGQINGRLYVDMRLIDGVDLDHLLTNETLGARRSVGLIEQVATALDAAHREGLVHRDVKPSNILVGARDFAYLIDFGLARRTDATQLTTAGQTMGTLAYMAPERYEWGAADARSDIYSLTCVLYQCLTRERPFGGDTLERQLRGHLLTPPPRPSTVDTGLNPAFDDVIAVGMAKDPGQRFASALELATAARAALDGTASQPPPTTKLIDETDLHPAADGYVPTARIAGREHDSSAALPPARRHRRWIAATIALVIVGLGTIGVVVWNRTEQANAAAVTAQHVRGVVERYDYAVRDGNLLELREMTCGALHDRYQRYTIAGWAQAHNAAIKAKQYPVEVGINDVYVKGEEATADVVEFEAAAPENRAVHAFGLRMFNGRWRICNDGR